MNEPSTMHRQRGSFPELFNMYVRIYLPEMLAQRGAGSSEEEVLEAAHQKALVAADAHVRFLDVALAPRPRGESRGHG